MSNNITLGDDISNIPTGLEWWILILSYIAITMVTLAMLNRIAPILRLHGIIVQHLGEQRQRGPR